MPIPKLLSMPDPQAGPSSEPHRMRIASGGSLSAYVAFALKFLEDNPHRPLVLHTLPPTPGAPPGAKNTARDPPKAAYPPAKSGESAPNNAQTAQPLLPAQPADDPGTVKPAPRPSTSTLLPQTLAIPKLISAVELIKRKHLERLAAYGGGKGKHKATGIWQYTRSGAVSPGDVAASLSRVENVVEGTKVVGDGTLDLARVLSGRTKPRLTHHPYLEITLSTRPLGLEKQPDVTCQYVLAKRRRTRAGKGKEDVRDGDDDAEVAESGVGGTKGAKGAEGAADMIQTSAIGDAVGVDVGVAVRRTESGRSEQVPPLPGSARPGETGGVHLTGRREPKAVLRQKQKRKAGFSQEHAAGRGKKTKTGA